MGYLSLPDLVRRWVYTRQGVHKLAHSAGFPPPAITDGAGRTRLWHMADIAAFEAAHPEVTSEEAKHNKVRGFAIANLKKKKAQGARPTA